MPQPFTVALVSEEDQIGGISIDGFVFRPEKELF